MAKAKEVAEDVIRELERQKRARNKEEERDSRVTVLTQNTGLQEGNPMPWQRTCDLEELSAGTLKVLRDECAALVHNHLCVAKQCWPWSQ